jgi:hypothetical protein
VKREIMQLPDERGKFVEDCLNEYKKVTSFNPKNYEI